MTGQAANTRVQPESLLAFAAEALGPVFTRRMLVPVIALAILLTASNIIILLYMPEPRSGLPSWPFVAGAVARIGGLWILAVATLRTLAASARPRWRPDGAFWLYGLAMFAGLAVAGLVGWALGGRTDLAGMLVANISLTLILTPFAAWVTALAVSRPLAWQPRRWLRRFRLWLPHLLFWSLLVLTPLAVLHAWADGWLMRGAGGWFWPVALADGPLSLLVALFGFALNAAAYRRVAQG